MSEPPQKEMPFSHPEGVHRVLPLGARISILEYAVILLLELKADTDVSGPDRARLLAALALVNRASDKERKGLV